MIRLILLTCLLAAPAAKAQFRGTVRGTVRTVDTRADPYEEAGYGFANEPLSDNANRAHFRQPGRFNGTTITVPEALVEVCVILVATAGCKPLWTRTNNAGQYTVTWWGLTSPVAIVSKVYAIRPQLDEGQVLNQDEIPRREFRITTAGFSNVNVGETWRFSATASLGDTQIININVAPAAREVMNAYLTARETYAMLSSQTSPGTGGTIRSDMQGLDIFANSAFDVGFGGGLAYFNDEVYLGPMTASRHPFTIPHEIGHIISWRSMDWWKAPYDFSAYTYGNDSSVSWRDLSNEYERPAFWEGFANAVGGLWMWKTNAAPRPEPGTGCARYGNTPGIPRGDTACLSLEDPSNGCGANSNRGHRRAMCVARAFWDLLDDPTGDEDETTNRDLGSIVRVFRSYPRWCPPFLDNGCRDEGDFDDNNWKDYRRNHENIFSSDANRLVLIEIINDLRGGNDG